MAEAVARSVDGSVKGGKVYELGGPEVRSFKELMQEMLTVIERKRVLIPVPFWAASIMGSVLGVLPGKILTKDQVKLNKVDNTVSVHAVKEGRTLEGMALPRTRWIRSCPLTYGASAPRGQYQKISAA